MRLKTLFALACMAFLVQATPPTGAELVRARLPQFYQALETTLSSQGAEAFLNHWTEREVAFVQSKARKLLEATIDSSSPIRSVRKLYAKYGSSIFGWLGEAHGSLVGRLQAEAAGAEFLDEDTYAHLNRKGRKPDGLLYRTEDGNLILTAVLESKMGVANFCKEQALGYLAHWKANGIQVEKSLYFPPDRIQLQTTDGFIPIREVTARELESHTILICTQPAIGFGGSQILLPFDASAAMEISYAWVKALAAGRPVQAVRSNYRVVPLEGTELEQYREQLRNWFLERGRWPRSAANGLERYLAEQVSSRGGQSKAFLFDMDGPTRHFATQVGNLPAIVPLESLLSSIDPEPHSISALRAFVRTYKQIPIVETLSTKPRWAAFFKEHPPEELKSADIDELNACLDLLLNAQKRQQTPGDTPQNPTP